MSAKRLLAAMSAAALVALTAVPAMAAPPSGDGQNKSTCDGWWNQSTKTCTYYDWVGNSGKVKTSTYTKDGDPDRDGRTNPNWKRLP